ncbi:hypothetical protein ABMB67_000361 [Halalkalibacter oceani]
MIKISSSQPSNLMSVKPAPLKSVPVFLIMITLNGLNELIYLYSCFVLAGANRRL